LPIRAAAQALAWLPLAALTGLLAWLLAGLAFSILTFSLSALRLLAAGLVFARLLLTFLWL
jgi:hypothetical protein